MNLKRDIKSVEHLTRGARLDIPAEPGVYAFRWIDERSKLLAANTHIVLAGPRGKEVDVHFLNWWPKDLTYPCLYYWEVHQSEKALWATFDAWFLESSS